MGPDTSLRIVTVFSRRFPALSVAVMVMSFVPSNSVRG